MILDIEKIAKLERKYYNDTISLEALRNMVVFVSSSKVDDKLLSSIQYLTLCDLGVIKEVEKRPQQLNS